MARFLIATIPVIGHVVPMLPIAKSLVLQGHDVRWYSGRLFETRIEATGAQFMPMAAGFDYSIPENVPPELAAKRLALKGLAQLKFDLEYFFIRAAIGNAQDLINILEGFPADLILADSFFLAAAWVHEAGGPPWAQLGISVLTLPSQDTAPFGLGLRPSSSLMGRFRNRALNGLLKNLVFRDLRQCIRQARSQFSLGPTDQILFDVISPYLYLASTVPGFEYPRSDLPPQVHFIGPSISESLQEFKQPAWWPDLTQSQPIVHVTQGTVASDPQDLIIPTIQALATEDVLVIATTGNRPVEGLAGFRLPDNVRVEQFIPYQNLLPYIDVMVTNGGFNGVQMALAQGIPLVAAGKSEDKPEVCARIAWSGVGIDLKTKAPKPGQIRQAVKQVLADSRYRQNAKRLQAEIQSYQTVEKATALLEKLAQTKQPILEPWT